MDTRTVKFRKCRYGKKVSLVQPEETNLIHEGGGPGESETGSRKRRRDCVEVSCSLMKHGVDEHTATLLVLSFRI